MTGPLPAWRWALRRFLLAVPVVAGVTALTFVLIHIAPGDPVYFLAGDGGSAAYYAEMRAKYGLDAPVLEQLLRYARAVASADLGYSFMYQAPAAHVLMAHAPATMLLGGAAVALGTLAGVCGGLLCAVSRSRAIDRSVRMAASFAYAAPVFWTGQMLILFASVKLGLLPVGGYTDARETLAGAAYAVDVARHLVLPATALALPFAAVVARVSRAALLETLNEPFVQALAARGFTYARVVVRHAAPNALVPIVALVGEHAAAVMAGAALTEALFGWPGVGYLVLHASLHRDYPLVTAAFILTSAAVVFVNAATDAVCAWLDPRVRLT